MTLLFLLLSLFSALILVHSSTSPLEFDDQLTKFSGNETYSVSFESSCKVPFSIYLTSVVGLANIHSISADESGAVPITDFVSEIVGTSYIITFPYIEHTSFYFSVSCTNYCYISIRQLDPSLPRRLYTEVTNYDILPKSKNISFTLSDYISEDSSYLVTVTSFNCTSLSDDHFITTLVLDKSKPDFILSGSPNGSCSLMIDVARYNQDTDWTYSFTADSKHYISVTKAKTSTLVLREATPSTELFVNNFVNNHLTVKRMMEIYEGNSATTIFTRDVIPITAGSQENDAVTLTTLNGETPLSEHYEITFKQTDMNVPMHLPLTKINREYIGNKPTMFYMSIPSTEGTLFVHQYGEYVPFCVRIKNKQQRDPNANWMFYTNLDLLCKEDQVQFDPNEETVFISKATTAKCGGDNCDMFITFMPTATTSTNGVETHNEVSIYYQQVKQVLDVPYVPFAEAIHGSFDENDLNYKYFTTIVPHGITRVTVYVEKALSDIAVYINTRRALPTESEWDYAMNSGSATIERVQITLPGEDKNLTLMVASHKYVQYQSQFKITIVPQYDNVQWLYSILSFGETAYCEVNDDNKCAFIVAVPKRNIINNVMYFNVDSESNTKAKSVVVNTISSNYNDVALINSFLEYTITEAALSAYLSSSQNKTFTNTNYIRVTDDTWSESHWLLYMEYTFESKPSSQSVLRVFSHWEYPKASIHVCPIFYSKYIYIPPNEEVSVTFDILPSMYTQLKKVENTLVSFINFTDSVEPTVVDEFTDTYLFETADPLTPVVKNKVSFINAGNYSGLFVLSSFPKSSFSKPYHTLLRGKQYAFTSTQRFHVTVSDQLTDAFTIIITTLRGQATINEVYNNTARSLNMSVFNVHLLDKQMRLELNANAKFGRTHEPASNFFFDVECVECAYQISRNDTHMETEHTTLHRDFTNYLLVQTDSNYYFHVNSDSQSKENYKYQVQINALDCAVDVRTQGSGKVVKHDYNSKVCAVTDISSNKDFVLQIKGTNTYQRNTCKIAVDVSSKGVYGDGDSNVDVAYFNITENSLHQMFIDDKTKQIAFTSAGRKGDTAYVYVNNYHYYVMEMQCGHSEKRTVIGKELYVYTRESNSDICTLRALTSSVISKYEVSVVLKNGGVNVPMFYPRDYFIKERIPLTERSVFYMTIPSITGKLVVHQPHVAGNVCIRIENHLTRDAKPNFNFLVDLDAICSNSITTINGETDFTNEISYELNSQVTGKCSSSDCEMYVLIQPVVELQNDDTSLLSSRGEITMYLIEQSQVVFVPPFEQIYGSFVHSSDTDIVYYAYTVPYDVNGLYVNIDKHDDNVILYAKQGSDKPTAPSEGVLVLERDVEMSVLISANADDTLQGRRFTFGVKPNAPFVKDKMHYKLAIEPRYKTSPVQVSHVQIGESSSCVVDHVNLYCVYMVYIHKHEVTNGWYFYIDFPYDAQLRDGVTVSIRKINYDVDMQYNDLFMYDSDGDEDVHMRFPLDGQYNVITLTDTRFYFDSNSGACVECVNDLTAMIIKVSLPRPAVTKIYTNYYTPQIDFMRSLSVFEKQVYHVKRGDYLTLLYYDDYELSTEICTIASAGSRETCYHYDTVEQTYNNLTINNDEDYTFTLGLYRDYMYSQPPLREFSRVNYIHFNQTTTVQDMIMLLPLNAKLNLHLFLVNVTEETAIDKQPRAQTGVAIDEQFTVQAKVISASAYSSLLLNSFDEDDITNAIVLDNKTSRQYAFGSFTSLSAEESYLYIKIVKKEGSVISSASFEIVAQEESKGSVYLIKEDQELAIRLTQSDSATAMGYAVELPEQEKYVIEITQTNEIAGKTLVRDFHLTTVPWSAEKENLTWYVEEVKQSESGMKIYITNRHRSSFGIGYYFEQGEVNVKLKVYVYKGVSTITVVSITVVVGLLVVIICLGDRLRRKKKVELGELKKKIELNQEIIRQPGSEAILDEAPAPLLASDNNTSPFTGTTGGEEKDTLYAPFGSEDIYRIVRPVARIKYKRKTVLHSVHVSFCPAIPEQHDFVCPRALFVIK